MKTRILTGIIGIPAILLCLFAARFLMVLFVLVLMGMSQYELSKMYGFYRKKNIFLMPMIGSVIFILLYLLCYENWAGLGIIVFFFLISIQAFILYPRVSIDDLTFMLFMLLYGGWTYMHAMVLYDAPRGSWLLLSVFLCIWSCDSGAYFSGSFFGRHRLAPQLSPKKSVEGAFGGILFSIGSMLLINKFFDVFQSIWLAAMFAVLIAILSIIGDLFESYIKRLIGVKDSGNILPGHGGFLDRFDSFIFVIPLCSFILPFLQA